MTKRNTTSDSQPCGCAVVSAIPGEDDLVWVGDEKHTHKFILSELIEAGLREKLSGIYSELLISKIVTECVGDLKEQFDDNRKRATAQDKINVMLEDGVYFDFATRTADRLVSLKQISQYIFAIAEGRRHDLFVNSTPTGASNS